MDLCYAFIVYFLLLIFLTFIFYCGLHIRFWSSFILGVIISVIALSLLCPISCVEDAMSGDSYIIGYYFIYLLTIFLILWYIIYHAYYDRWYNEDFKNRSITFF